MNDPSAPATHGCETSEPGCSPAVDPPLPASQKGEEPLVILVPVDFSAEARVAVAYAVDLASAAGGGVRLLHVNTQQHGDRELKRLFHGLFEDLALDSPLPYSVVEGAVATALPEAAKGSGASYVVVTSREMRDPERFKQSTVLKILRRGCVPYIALQGMPRRAGVRVVVFPMDYTDESRMALPHLAKLHQRFAPTFHLVTSRVNEPELFDRVEEHLENTRELLDRLGAPYVVHEIESLEEYTAALLEYGESVEADLLVLVSTIDPRAKALFMLEPHDRALLQQGEGMGVLVINPQREG